MVTPYTPSGGGGGNVATDAIWDAKGDLAAGTAADTAARLAVGTNGQVLTADSAQATGLKWAASGSGNLLFENLRIGRAHGSHAARATQAMTADRLVAIPFIVGVAISIDALSLDVTTAGAAGSNAIMGVYTDNGDGYPDALVSGTKTAELDTSATGVKVGTFIAVPLSANTLYWLVAAFEGAPTVRTNSGHLFEAIVGLADATSGSNNASGYWQATRTYDADLPATFTAGGSTGGSGNSPSPLFLAERSS